MALWTRRPSLLGKTLDPCTIGCSRCWAATRTMVYVPHTWTRAWRRLHEWTGASRMWHNLWVLLTFIPAWKLCLPIFDPSLWRGNKYTAQFPLIVFVIRKQREPADAVTWISRSPARLEHFDWCEVLHAGIWMRGRRPWTLLLGNCRCLPTLAGACPIVQHSSPGVYPRQYQATTKGKNKKAM